MDIQSARFPNLPVPIGFSPNYVIQVFYCNEDDATGQTNEVPQEPNLPSTMNNKIKTIRSKSIRPTTLLLISLVLLTVIDTTIADDTEIYRGVARPKILFVLDSSGSMGRFDRGFQRSRMARMKNALSQLLRDLRGVDVGLMEFSGTRNRANLGLLHEGAEVEANQSTLQSALDSIRAGGGTPTVAALYEASRYFRGETPYRGRTLDGGSNYISPITQECESSHVVLLTDGAPDQRDNPVADIIAPM